MKNKECPCEKCKKQMRIRNDIAEIYQDEYPNIETAYFKNGYCSTIKKIGHFQFDTKEEVILVNAIYENTKDNFEVNKFRNDFIYTFKLLGVKSKWI